jgi:hypothetical protein
MAIKKRPFGRIHKNDKSKCNCPQINFSLRNPFEKIIRLKQHKPAAMCIQNSKKFMQRFEKSLFYIVQVFPFLHLFKAQGQ